MSIQASLPTPVGRRRAGENALALSALALLAEGVSYGDLSVGRIAERAGRGRTGFYFYFRDKRELLLRLTEQMADAMLAEAGRWWDDSGTEDELRAALAALVRAYGDRRELIRAVVEASASDDVIAESWRASVERFLPPTRQRLIASGWDAGHAHGTAFVLVWATERACYQHVMHAGTVEDAWLIDALAGIWERSGHPPS